jgi:hypothetical protein
MLRKGQSYFFYSALVSQVTILYLPLCYNRLYLPSGEEKLGWLFMASNFIEATLTIIGLFNGQSLESKNTVD